MAFLCHIVYCLQPVYLLGMHVPLFIKLIIFIKIHKPIIIAEKDFWVAYCIHCYATSQHHNETKKESIKNIRHEKGCSFLPDIKTRNKEITKEQYLRIFPPRDLKKKN